MTWEAVVKHLHAVVGGEELAVLAVWEGAVWPLWPEASRGRSSPQAEAIPLPALHQELCHQGRPQRSSNHCSSKCKVSLSRVSTLDSAELCRLPYYTILWVDHRHLPHIMCSDRNRNFIFNFLRRQHSLNVTAQNFVGYCTIFDSSCDHIDQRHLPHIPYYRWRAKFF